MSRFFKPIEAVDIRMLGNEDYQKRDRMRLLKWTKYVWQDMNISTVKKAVRKRYAINKKTNSVDLDCNFLQLSSVNIVDRNGIEYPVYRNNRILADSDIVDVGEAKDCACEFNCKSNLCNTIKSYEAIIETVEEYMPNGTLASFDCVSRKGIDEQGFYYEQKQYPKRIYEDGTWTNTILYTETNKKCKVEVDENGCVCDTDENLNNICEACGISSVNTNLCCIGGSSETPPDDTCNTWIYYCNNKMDWFSTQCGGFPYMSSEACNIYNVSELGDRLIFPPNFGWDNVIIRTYEDIGLEDIQIPIIAIDTYITGLMWWDCRFNDRKQTLAMKYAADYARLKFGLLKELNKYRIAELGKIMAPPAYIPSYVSGRTNQYEGSYRNYIRL